MRRYLRVHIAMIATVAAALTPAAAQDKPRYGGELLFVVPSEPPSYDAHREETFGVMHPMAPHYNTLLRIDPERQDGHQARRRPRRVVDGRPRMAVPTPSSSAAA